MVRIRLRRVGAKKQPSYRVVVADSESPRDGRFIENIGFYNPLTDPPTVEIKAERALYWLQHGAQPSDSVAKMLQNLGIMDKFAKLKAGTDMDTLLAELAREKAAAEKKRTAEQEAAKAEEVGPVEEVTETEAEEAPAELTVEEEDTRERVD